MNPRLGRRRRIAVPVAVTLVLAAGVTAGMVGGGATSVSAANAGQIRVPAGGKVIPGSYIVMLKDTAGAKPGTKSSAKAARDSRKHARDITARHGGKVTHEYTVMNGFSLRTTPAKARQVAADPTVAYVEQDTQVRLNDTQNDATWGLDRIDQQKLPVDSKYTYTSKAENVSAYIIDTGIRTSHSDFAGRASVGVDTVGDGRNGIDCNGHGTHVAGTVGGNTWGVAKGVKLYAVRVLDCEGGGSNSAVLGGVDWVTKNAKKPAVANMSLGGGVSAALDTAVRNSISSGVTYALAAGNESQDACNSSPARTAEAITVGATTITDARASFSNFGTCLDIFAPGEDITSAWNTDDTSTNTISGTSMAAPHTAGTVALFLSATPAATPQQVRDGLVAAATNGVVTDPGANSPNKLLYTVFGGGTPPTPPPGGTFFENATKVNIPDQGTAVESTIDVTGVSGGASAAITVGVDIKHPYSGDLVIDLVAPDGSSHRLKNSSAFDGTVNLVTTYTVNAKAVDGTWKLRVGDVFAEDTGHIEKWSLRF